MIFDAVDSKLRGKSPPRISNLYRILDYTNGTKPIISKLRLEYQKYGDSILAVTDLPPTGGGDGGVLVSTSKLNLSLLS